MEDRGGFQIQGSLLLDDKYPGSCTEVVPGMYKPENLKFWYKQVVNRAQEKGESVVDRAVTKVDRNTLIEKDLDKMGTG
jgi:hypothetical protein